MNAELLCTRCGNDESFELKEKNPHTGIYCKKCGAWIKWANDLEIKQLSKQKNNDFNLMNFNISPSSLNLIPMIDTDKNENIYEINNTWFNEHNPKINVLKETYDKDHDYWVYSFGYFEYNMSYDNSYHFVKNYSFTTIIKFISNTKAI